MPDVAAKLQELEERFGSEGRVSHLDGVSIDAEDWHMNVRPSNTEPLLRLNLEARSKELMERKRDEVAGGDRLVTIELGHADRPQAALQVRVVHAGRLLRHRRPGDRLLRPLPPLLRCARVEYHRHLDLLETQPSEGEFVMRANTIEYHAPARFDDLIEVFIRVAQFGRTSVSYELAAYKQEDDVLMVTAQQTLVLVDLAERRARAIPDWYREKIGAFEGEDLER